MNIFGRDKIIASIWQTLEEKSVLLTAERRIGKTEVLKQMRDNAPEDYIVIFSDLEKVSTPIEFVNDIIKQTSDLLNNREKVKNIFGNLLESFNGIEIGGVIKVPETQGKDWKALLTQVVGNLCENHPDETLLFLWDEVPYMLQKIENSGDGQSHFSSLEVLDVLRALRMEQANLRMVFTGSIGLHHVVKALKKETLPTQPINDMDKVNLPKLTLADANEMANYRIVKKEKLQAEPDEVLLTGISEACDCIPFYIEKLIKHFASYDIPLTVENIDTTIEEILVSGDDNWELAHFRSRLKEYYQGEVFDEQNNTIADHQLAKALLDHIVVSDEPQSLNACFAALKTQFALTESHRQHINELLTLLVKDHYLTKKPRQGYQFTFTIVQRWWIEAEGLY